jgi:hypothetical protein
VHSQATVSRAIRLRDEEGLGARKVARRLGLPIGTVRDWHAGKLPWHSRPTSTGKPRRVCPGCEQSDHSRDRLGREYVHLLGLYLGDGSISKHRRGVYRLRVSLDQKYPRIVYECARSMQDTMPASKVHRLLTPSNCYSVSAYSRSWPCLFPQHGPGVKHSRPIYLASWQQELAETWPDQLLKGLIQSDGCRFTNTGRGGWSNPRYSFSNVSTDITSIFCTACDCLGLRWTMAFPKSESAAVTVYVSRKADVARLEEFVGPKS